MRDKLREWGENLGCFALGLLFILGVITMPLWAPFAMLYGLVQALRARRTIASIDDDTIRRRLATVHLGSIPAVLQAPVPRDERTFEGLRYLDQGRYRQRYIPLLRDGFATRGLCVYYASRGGGDDFDAHCVYAWIDERGQVRRGEVREGYDAENAARGSGRGEIVWDMDAELGTDKVVTIVSTDDDHVLFDAFG